MIYALTETLAGWTRARALVEPQTGPTTRRQHASDDDGCADPRDHACCLDGRFLHLPARPQRARRWFIAGLIVSIAVVMQYMASGFAWTSARLRYPYHGVIGAGVLIAGLTGIGSWFFGKPFLTSDFTYVRIPPFEKFELATAASVRPWCVSSPSSVL